MLSMRGALIAVGLLALASQAPAGVYNLAERLTRRPENYRDHILLLRSAAAPRPGEFKAALTRQAEALEREKADGVFSTIDRVNLSGCYLRLGRPHDAVRLLLRGDQSHFLIQSNLAAAYFLA